MKTKLKLMHLTAVCLVTLAFALAFALHPSTSRADDPPAGAIAGKLKGKKKYRKDAVVYLTGISTPPPADGIKLGQKDQKFQPRILVIVKGSTVIFTNEDNTEHNVFSPDHETYNLGKWGKGAAKEYVFKREGVYTQLCKIHPSMLGYVLSLPNRYFAHVSKKGRFEIKNIPPGTYKLKVWSERGEAEEIEVTVKDGETTKAKIKVGKRKRK